MVRLFTLSIPFRDKEYVALIQMRQRDDEVYCQVRYVEKGLPHLLPGDDFSLCVDGKVKVPVHCPDELSKNLAACTMHAVSDYLNGIKN